MGKTMALKPISGLKRNRAQLSSSRQESSPVAQAMSHAISSKSPGWLDGLLDKGIASQAALGRDVVTDLAARCKSESKAATTKGKSQVKEMQVEAEVGRAYILRSLSYVSTHLYAGCRQRARRSGCNRQAECQTNECKY
jgi:polyhydroxyalkanoate synthesis regulator phasin